MVAAASEAGGVVTNGMSYQARAGENSNSAVLVSVLPTDFADAHPLAGVRFQREIEQAAFRVAGKTYNAPAQKLSAFLGAGTDGTSLALNPTYLPGVVWCGFEDVFPGFVNESLKQGLRAFDRKMHGFAHPDAILTGPETRSSSPVRILRDPVTLQSRVKGLYPCGEGAGYAGGIMSAAVDGIKVFEAIIKKERSIC